MNKKRKNLLFIFTDEQAVHTMKCYGNTRIHTPHMDKLADQSFVFDNAYVTQPVCTPSRSTIMTGLYPHSNGCMENNIPLSNNTPCFVELGDFSSYRTGYYGKWHLGDEIFLQHGFEEWRSVEDLYHKYYSDGRGAEFRSTYSEFLENHGIIPDLPHGHYSRSLAAKLPEHLSKPAYLANEAIDFLERHQEEPFVLYVNFFEPHMPYFSCRNDQYKPQDIPLPGNYSHQLDENNPIKTKAFKQKYYDNGHSGLPLQSEDDWKQLTANYWGAVSLVDTHLGRILDRLESLNLADDTIIVYTSDHGDMMASHQLTAKCVMFEEAVKVPLLIKIPGIKSDVENITSPVSQIDLVPTLLDAMEYAIPEHLEGYSLLPFLSKTGDMVDKDVYIQWNGTNANIGSATLHNLPESYLKLGSPEEILASIADPVRTLITPEGWKYNKSTIGEDELYYLKEDPLEMHNLVQDPQYTSIIHDLEQRIQKKRAHLKDY